MKKEKVSLICTVKNEESGIKEFMESIIKQTLLPDEFIIVDGGSTDKTFEILKKLAKKYKWIKVYQVKGANIAQGRNYAIEKSKGEIIAVCDAGCVIDKNWLKYITLPLKEGKANIVVGNYRPLARNKFEYFQGVLVVKPGPKLLPTRASSRSIAFKKYVWKEVGGYPEKFLTGEDTFFNVKAFRKFKVIYEPRAIVYWKMRPNLKSFFKQFFMYGKGAKLQGNLLRIKRDLIGLLGFWFFILLFVVFLFVNPTISLILVLLVLAYLFLYSFKVFLKTKKLSAFLYVPVLEFTKRVAFALGATFG